MAKRFFRPLGLRPSRLAEWVRALRAAERPVGWRDWRAMLHLLVTAPFRPRRAALPLYRRCVRCPYHDRALRQCALCGCYMPYKLAAGGGCAARESDPTSPIGF